MSFFSEMMLSIRTYGEAIQLIRKNRLSPLLLISFFLFLTILSVCGYLIYVSNLALVEWMLQTAWLGRWSSILSSTPWMLTLFKIGINISTLFLFVSFYKYFFLAIASPLYAYIAERCAEKVNNIEYPFTIGQFLLDIQRGIRISLRNFVRQFFFTFIFFVLSFFPIIGFIFSLLILLLDAYFYGFSMLDYNCERERMPVKESIKWIQAHRGLALGNGLIFYFSMVALPFLGVLLVAPISAISGCIAFYKTYQYS